MKVSAMHSSKKVEARSKDKSENHHLSQLFTDGYCEVLPIMVSYPDNLVITL